MCHRMQLVVATTEKREQEVTLAGRKASVFVACQDPGKFNKISVGDGKDMVGLSNIPNRLC